MNKQFEEFWEKTGNALAFAAATEADKKTVEDYKTVFAAVWNDAQQLMLARIVFLIMNKKKEILKNHVEGQQTTAAVINALGQLAVEISELKT